MKVSLTWGEFARGTDLPANEHHTLTVKANATLEVVDAAGNPAAKQAVIVRHSDGTEQTTQTNAAGRLFLYSLDPKATFEVRLNRRAKQVT